MNWQDEGFLLSKFKFRENANIINVFTSTHGKVSGIVYGGNSRKIRNFLQIVKAHIGVYGKLFKMLKKRSQLNYLNKYFNENSIVFKYFILKKKKFFH